MAAVTTVNGVAYSINPETIAVVSGEPGTACAVVGPAPGTLRLNEAGGALLARLGIAADFAQLTRPDGSPVWIGGKAVSSLRAPLSGEFPAAAKTVIYAGSTTQAVQEDPAAVVVALNAHGGKV